MCGRARLSSDPCNVDETFERSCGKQRSYSPPPPRGAATAAPLSRIIENGAPRRAGLAAHVLDSQQHLLAVLADTEHDQEHDRGGLPVKPDPHHGAIQDQADDRLLGQRAGIPGVPIAFHLAPHAARRILADRAAEDGLETREVPSAVIALRTESSRWGMAKREKAAHVRRGQREKSIAAPKAPAKTLSNVRTVTTAKDRCERNVRITGSRDGRISTAPNIRSSRTARRRSSPSSLASST